MVGIFAGIHNVWHPGKRPASGNNEKEKSIWFNEPLQ